MERIKAIEDKINRLQEKLVEARGTQTEVYSRIVGYYRSVRNWNRGKRSEYEIRRMFDVPDSIGHQTISPQSISEMSAETETTSSGGTSVGDAVEYRYFYRTTCPNCPPMRQFLENSGLSGEMIDVDERPEAAIEDDVMAAPTVLLLDEEGRETARVHTLSQMKTALAGMELFVGA